MQYMAENTLVREVEKRLLYSKKKIAFAAWFEAINHKRLFGIVSTIQVNRDLARKRGIFLHWHSKCARREADLWKHTRDIFRSLQVLLLILGQPVSNLLLPYQKL